MVLTLVLNVQLVSTCKAKQSALVVASSAEITGQPQHPAYIILDLKSVIIQDPPWRYLHYMHKL